MKTTLNYNFTRKSKDYLDWLLNIINSEKYFELDAMMSNSSDTTYIH